MSLQFAPQFVLGGFLSFRSRSALASTVSALVRWFRGLVVGFGGGGGLSVAGGLLRRFLLFERRFVNLAVPVRATLRESYRESCCRRKQ